MTKEQALTTGIQTSASQKRLTYEEILAAKDKRTEVIDMPEWGGTVTIQELTANDRSDIENDAVKTQQGEFDIKAWRMRFVVLSVIDEHGNRMFDDTVDVDALQHKSYVAINRIFERALKLNGMDAKTGARAQDFTDDQPSGSSSD